MIPEENPGNEHKLSHLLGWLADAPLYINSAQLEKFYDAVVKPENKRGKTTVSLGDEEALRIKGSGFTTIGGELSAGDLLTKIANLFPSIKISGSVSASGEGEKTNKKTRANSVELLPIDNPHRQLVHLAIYYLFNHSHRLELVLDAGQPDWFNPESIVNSPKKLVFIDLPSQAEALQKGLPQVKLVPTAAEFANGKVVTLFEQFQKTGGGLIDGFC